MSRHPSCKLVVDSIFSSEQTLAYGLFALSPIKVSMKICIAITNYILPPTHPKKEKIWRDSYTIQTRTATRLFVSFLHKCSICLCSIAFQKIHRGNFFRNMFRDVAPSTINIELVRTINSEIVNCLWIFTNQRSGQWKLPILNLNVSAISTVGFPNTIPGSKIGMGPKPAGVFEVALNSGNPRSLTNSSPLKKWMGKEDELPSFLGFRVLPSLKLTVGTWKWTPGSLEIPIWNHHF